ncbi:related to hydrolases of the alpha/beta superfamily [Fusarium torulosum]|uniref:Related to hydrolases of the alpha/beta superfamily n=1 Tax=Fusarium torulosum TaxID=33205 RepID=A0AAE8MP79_9HYPO|nr:related to hydrolases of the alpha/beta superfamily [Fusarium torulosum]
MGIEAVSFQTVDHVTLRGLFFTPANYSGEKLPCVIISHGFSAVKEGGLTAVAEHFTANLPITCLVFDNRGFGESDTGDDQPRLEVDATAQTNDISDAITYSQTRPEVNAAKIGIWGSSFSGGNVIWVAAVDRRVKAVVSQAPLMDGWSAFANLLRSDELAEWEADFQKDRIGRAAGKPPMMIPVVDPKPLNRSAMTTKDSNMAMANNEKIFPTWKNKVTLKSMENLRAHPAAAWIHRISPTPLLLSVAANDTVTPTATTLEGYNRALEPKELHIVECGHYEMYAGFPNFEDCVKVQADFFKRKLCSI